MKKYIVNALLVIAVVVLSVLCQWAAVRLGWYRLGEVPPPAPAPVVEPVTAPAPVVAPAPAPVVDAPKAVEPVKPEAK